MILMTVVDTFGALLYFYGHTYKNGPALMVLNTDNYLKNRE